MRSLLFGAVIVLVGLGGFLLMSTTSVTPEGKVKLGQTPSAQAACTTDDCLPDFEATTLAGAVITENDLHGKTVLVNHWATWCGPCVKELPALDAVYRRYQDQGFVVLGLANDGEDVERVKRFTEAHHVSYPVVPLDGNLARVFGRPQLLPTSILYGPDGHVKQTFQGSISEEELTAALAK